jgi:uncharacterized membrane protein
MSSSGAGGRSKDALSTFLGVFSLGLGVPQIVAPQLVNQLIGVRDDDTARTWQRIVGTREIAAGVGILSRPRPAPWLWARVAGDVMDLSLLGVSLLTKPRAPQRIVAAMGSVGGIMVADLAAAVRMTRRRRPEEPKQERRVRTAVTVRRPREDVERFWHDFRRTIEWGGESIQFTRAPGNRGTEIHVELQPPLPGGRLGEGVAKLAGRVTEQLIEDDLRRFKQVLETGIVVRSDGSPEGPSTVRLLLQRPAQPLPAGVGPSTTNGGTGS